MARRKNLKDEIDELFADLWQVSRLTGVRRGFRPNLDSFRSPDPSAFTVVVELAGIDPDEVQITATDDALVISGQRRRQPAEGRVYQQIEIEYGPFERVVHLPEDVDVSHAEARYERGLLMIHFPIAQKAERRERVPIEIQRRT